MHSQAILVKKISQKDNHTFTILWSDNKSGDYKLHELQQRCPCANCIDEGTGFRKQNAAIVSPAVKAVRITNVGRYALRIQFTSGCSSGIYSFNMLYDLISQLGET